jgi:hypothetical protein
MNAFTGSWMKVRRAEEHLQALDLQLQRAMNDDPPAADVDIDRGAMAPITVITLRMASIPDLGEDVAATVGDVVHNLRSALDHLAWSLVPAYCWHLSSTTGT